MQAGDAPQLDVTRSDVALARAEADYEAAVAADQNATEALRIETNVDAGTLTATVPQSPPPIVPALLDPQAVVALARTLRPEIASARLTADAARAAVSAAKAAGFPAITVSGGYVTGTGFRRADQRAGDQRESDGAARTGSPRSRRRRGGQSG